MQNLKHEIHDYALSATRMGDICAIIDCLFDPFFSLTKSHYCNLDWERRKIVK